jgi:TRAP-type mannitol/chloroaromatic compound transport system substrate-binding protein
MDDIKILPFPDDVLAALKQASDEIIAEISARDEKFNTIYKSFINYMNTVSKWTEISEFAMLANRYKKD